MEKLNFACPWGKGDIKQSWSGTHYALYSHLQKYYKVENVNVLQFDECPAVHGDERHYVYQDLSADYVLKMAISMPDVFAHSGFQHASIQKIQVRVKMQNAFYAKAAGIFTMGKWLVKELKEDKDISVKDKVHHVGRVST